MKTQHFLYKPLSEFFYHWILKKKYMYIQKNTICYARHVHFNFQFSMVVFWFNDYNLSSHYGIGSKAYEIYTLKIVRYQQHTTWIIKKDIYIASMISLDKNNELIEWYRRREWDIKSSLFKPFDVESEISRASTNISSSNSQQK